MKQKTVTEMKNFNHIYSYLRQIHICLENQGLLLTLIVYIICRNESFSSIKTNTKRSKFFTQKHISMCLCNRVQYKCHIILPMKCIKVYIIHVPDRNFDVYQLRSRWFSPTFCERGKRSFLLTDNTGRRRQERISFKDNHKRQLVELRDKQNNSLLKRN